MDGSPKKGKLQKMKTMVNEKPPDDDNFTFNERNTEKEDSLKLVNETNVTNKKNEIEKNFVFRKTVDCVEIESFKVFNIDTDEEPSNEKCFCNKQCVIF